MTANLSVIFLIVVMIIIISENIIKAIKRKP